MLLLWFHLTLCRITITYFNKPTPQTRTLWILNFEYPENCEVKSFSSVVVTSHTESPCLRVCKTSQSFVSETKQALVCLVFSVKRKSGNPQSLEAITVPEGFNEQCITYQRSQSYTPPPPPTHPFVAPSLSSLSVVCLSVLCYVAFSPSPVCHGWLCSLFVSLPPLLMPSFSFIWLFRAVEISQLMHQSHCRLVTLLSNTGVQADVSGNVFFFFFFLSQS